MERRSFLGILGGMGLMASAADSAGTAGQKKIRYYELHQFYLKHGTQIGRLHDFLGKQALPALNRAVPGPKIFLEALVAPHMPQVAMVIGYHSLEEIGEAGETLRGDKGFGQSLASWEEGAEAPLERYSTTLLEAADYSPEILVPEKPRETSRIFELRVYHSPSHRQLGLLHKRFAGPEIKIFHRVGVHPLFYSSTVFGPDKPNLTYLIPFENLNAREKAWDAFGADPEWIKVRKESIDEGGQIASVIQISLYKATAYSPVR